MDKPLRYLIGKDNDPGIDGQLTEVGYDGTLPKGIGIKYCNLFDERNLGIYGPYLQDSDTAKEYSEGQIDPTGPGWHRNLRTQFELARKQGFTYIELDNPDAYDWPSIKSALDLASRYDLQVLAKNAAICKSPALYLAHPSIVGCIVEKGCGEPQTYQSLRIAAGKALLPIWFVAYGSGKMWHDHLQLYTNMYKSYSSSGEYSSSDIQVQSSGSSQSR